MNESIHSLTQSTQQAGDSWKESVSDVTDIAVDTVTTTFEQAKVSVEQTLGSAEQAKNATSTAVSTAISSSINSWVEEHPILFRLIQILSWAANHPIISLVILLFALAIIFSLVKAIGRLIESASLSLLQVPFKLLLTLVKSLFLASTRVGNLAVTKLTPAEVNYNIPALLPETPQISPKDKQQRLAEISLRLEEIQNEQNQLLKEAAAILASEEIDIKVDSIQ
ncbi:MAG: hypothetical protein SAK29_03925 [Scytonema sp. PMC 1069.18]|nr:hypothetical protein [Scytonema sp. PMC 1069.18]MEC4881010.1 hypothetical protein [Scytonema sp. PMC 1070.18]